MKLRLRAPGGETTWTACLMMIGGVWFIVKAFGPGIKHPIKLEIIGTIWTATGAGLWFRQKWAKWLGMVASLYYSLQFAWDLVTVGYTLNRALGMISVGYFTWLLYKDPLGVQPEAKDEENGPLISLVLLLSKARYLEDKILAHAITKAWEVPVSTKDEKFDDEEGTTFVVGQSPLFITSHRGTMYMINNFDRQYFDEVEKVAEDCKELRIRKAILEHKAWLSVDLLGKSSSLEDEQTAYLCIGKLVAELSTEDCMAIFCPQTGQLNIYDPALDEKLRSDKPLEVFGHMPLLPVIAVDDDDPAMNAAVEEAKRRWPEFKEAFAKRKPDQIFSAKAGITRNGNTEFIWFKVAGLAGGEIHGYLDNDPVNLGELKHGDYVSVPESDLNDWVYKEDDRIVGMFTTKVLMKGQKPDEQEA